MKRWIVIGWLLGGVALPCAGAAEALKYKVKPGDSLGVIARRHGTTVAAIKSGNGLKSDTIIVGQQLSLPAAKAKGTTLRPQRHLVEQGETLWRIGRRYGVSAEELMRINGLVSPQALRAGTWLVLGAKGAAAASGKAAPRVAATAKTKAKASPPSAASKRTQTVTTKNETKRTERSDKGVDGAGQAVSFRTIRLSKNETLAALAKRHAMSVEQINIINGWDYQAGTRLAAGSEAHVLNRKIH